MTVVVAVVLSTVVIILLVLPGLMTNAEGRASGSDLWIESSWVLFAFVCCATFWGAKFGVSVRWVWYALVLVLAMLAAFAVWRVARRRVQLPVRSLAVALLTALYLTLIPVLVSSSRELGAVGKTLGNGDMYTYILNAMNLYLAGFRDAGHLPDVDLGHYVAHDYIAAPAIVGLTSVIAGPLDPSEVSWSAMSVAVFLAIGGLARFAQALFPKGKWPVLAGALAVAMPLVAYSVGQYFLSYIVGLGSAGLILSGFLGAAQGAARALVVIRVAAGCSVGLFSYPHMTIPIVLLAAPGIFILGMLGGVGPSWGVSLWWSRMKAPILGLMLATLACLPWLPEAFRQVTARASAGSTTGWPIATPTPAAVWLSPELIGVNTAQTWLIIIWAAVGSLSVWALVKRMPRRQVVVPVTALLALAAAGSAGVLIMGPGTYAAFKLMSFLLPLAWLSVLPLLMLPGRGHRTRDVVAVTVFGTAGLLAPLSLWVNADTAQISFTDLDKLEDIDELRSVTRLNVRLAHPIEEMAAATVLSWATIHFTQPLYAPPTSDTGTCTLVRIDRLAPEETNRARRLNDTYALLPDPAPCR